MNRSDPGGGGWRVVSQQAGFIVALVDAECIDYAPVVHGISKRDSTGITQEDLPGVEKKEESAGYLNPSEDTSVGWRRG